MKKIITSIIITGIISTIAIKSNAAFFFPIGPIQDYLKMAKEQLKTLDDQIIFSEKLEQAYAALEESGIIATKEIDEKNAMWGNKSVREARRVQEMSRLDQMSKSMPAFMPCGSVTNTIFMKHINKNKDNYVDLSSKKLKKINILAEKTEDDSTENLHDILVKGLENTIEGNKSNFEKTGEQEEQYNDAYIANASLLFSSDSKYDTLKEEQKIAMESFVLLVAPPYQASNQEVQMSKLKKDISLKMVNQQIKRNMSNQVFNRLLSKRISLGESYPSEMKVMRKNINKLYFNPEKPTETVAYKIQMSQMATPSVVMRNYAIIMSNRVHHSLLEYEENLSIEGIKAQLLLEEIN